MSNEQQNKGGNMIKRIFYTVTNYQGDYIEAVFSTSELAYRHVDRRKADILEEKPYANMGDFRVTKSLLTKNELDMILEGANTDIVWDSASLT